MVPLPCEFHSWSFSCAGRVYPSMHRCILTDCEISCPTGWSEEVVHCQAPSSHKGPCVSFKVFFDENVVGEELFGDMPVRRLVRACDICACIQRCGVAFGGIAKRCVEDEKSSRYVRDFCVCQCGVGRRNAICGFSSTACVTFL